MITNPFWDLHYFGVFFFVFFFKVYMDLHARSGSSKKIWKALPVWNSLPRGSLWGSMLLPDFRSYLCFTAAFGMWSVLWSSAWYFVLLLTGYFCLLSCVCLCVCVWWIQIFPSPFTSYISPNTALRNTGKRCSCYIHRDFLWINNAGTLESKVG